MSNLLFVDLENTGLNEFANGAQVLEVAALKVNEQMQETDYFSAPCALADGYQLENGARGMHEENGLLNACLRSSSTVYQVESSVLEWIGDLENLVLCGSSVHYDRRWLKVHMPRLFYHLHYQQMDVTSLLIARRCFEPEFKVERNKTAHRALADIRDTLKLFHALTTKD